MSMHKIPLTEIERSGLEAHKLTIGSPSQNSDCFRLGVAWCDKSNLQRAQYKALLQRCRDVIGEAGYEDHARELIREIDKAI